MYSKILLTLDDSDVAQQAIPHALSLARHTGAALVLLTVIDSEAQMIMQASGATIEPIAVGQVSAEIAHESVVAQHAEAQARLDATRRVLEAEGVRDVTTVVREGQPGHEIVAAVEELGCDVVVMASHGRSGIKRAILGSVADHVARHVRGASVLLVSTKE